MTVDIPENSPLFRGIDPSDLEDVLACLAAVRKEYKKNESIVCEGDRIENVGVLLSGSAQSTKTDVTGKLVIVTLIEPGNYIGVLLSASHNRRSPVTVRAAADLAVLFIPIRNILERSCCPHHARLIGNLLDGIAEKALILHDRNDCLIKPTIRDKVLTFLAHFAHDAKSRSFSIPMDRNAMAEYLDVDRSALSRELSWMKRDGLIDYNRNWFKLRL
jgi:cAMP-binding proteins - catabolite gene activator and regulatory subunit of cAMP-dependent protein kinases